MHVAYQLLPGSREPPGPRCARIAIRRTITGRRMPRAQDLREAGLRPNSLRESGDLTQATSCGQACARARSLARQHSPRAACAVQWPSPMYEAAVCRELLSYVAECGRAHQAGDACRLVVRMGPLANVEPARLIEEFALLSARMLSQRPTLHVEALPPQLRCGECGCDLPPSAEVLVCPECGQNHPVLLNAEDLELRLVEFSATYGQCPAPEHTS